MLNNSLNKLLIFLLMSVIIILSSSIESNIIIIILLLILILKLNLLLMQCLNRIKYLFIIMLILGIHSLSLSFIVIKLIFIIILYNIYCSTTTKKNRYDALKTLIPFNINKVFLFISSFIKQSKINSKSLLSHNKHTLNIDLLFKRTLLKVRLISNRLLNYQKEHISFNKMDYISLLVIVLYFILVVYKEVII